MENVGRLFNGVTVTDSWGRPVLLFRNEWNLQQTQSDFPDLQLNKIAPVVSGKEPEPV
jgi:peptide chain release factor 3